MSNWSYGIYFSYLATHYQVPLYHWFYTIHPSRTDILLEPIVTLFLLEDES